MSKNANVLAPVTPASNEILDEKRCAALLGVQPRCLRDWRQQRGLPFIKITSKIIRYRRADIDAWLARMRVAIVP
jgi:predicted DNA-binding transcriptional regulator AlpA